MNYEEETLIQSPFILSLEEEEEIDEEGVLGDGVIDALEEDLDVPEEEGVPWDTADKQDDDEEEEEAGDEY